MKIKPKFKEFIYQSFRPHGKEEYAELFTRGVTERNGANTVYPWFYLRVLAVMAAVYTVYAVINSILPGAGDWETFYFVGGAFLDVALLGLAFELYPYKDFSLITLLCVLLIGGVFSEIISAFIYHFHGADIILNGWKLAAIAGVGEEISKAVPTIIFIIVLKKKDTPIAGFLIGAAVGTWFSLTENASYIHSAYPMAQRVLTATARAFGAPFSHAMWAALIGWAFCKFKKPFLNFRFYGVVILCMALHFSIDMPLWDYIAILFAEAAVCGLIAFFSGIAVIIKERRLAFPDEQICVTQPAPLSQAHVINITLTSYGAILCALLLLLSAVYSPTSYKKTEYTAEEFVSFAQNGYVIEPDLERVLDKEAQVNYLEQYEQGKLTYVQQMVTVDEINYLYCYSIKEDEENAEIGDDEENGSDISEGGENTDGSAESGEEQDESGFDLVAVRVMIVIEGEERWFTNLTFSLVESDSFISFYHINPDFDYNEFKEEHGKIMRYTQINVPTWQTITVLSVTAAVAVSGVVTYFVLKRKLSEN